MLVSTRYVCVCGASEVLLHMAATILAEHLTHNGRSMQKKTTYVGLKLVGKSETYVMISHQNAYMFMPGAIVVSLHL